MKKSSIGYFEKVGKSNTTELIEIVVDYLKSSDIEYLVVASNTGKSAQALWSKIRNPKLKLVVVTHHAGFSGGDILEFDTQIRQELENDGVKYCTGSHALSGLSRSISKKFGGTTPIEIVAHTLRLFGGHGTKVAVEVAVMAADAGLVPTTCNILALGGTVEGLDTAIVLKAAHQNNFFDLRIREILAKPL